MLRLSNIKLPPDYTNQTVINKIVKSTGIPENQILSWQFAKKSIDARKKNQVFFVCTIDITLQNEEKYIQVKNVQAAPEHTYEIPRIKTPFPHAPIVVGSGPAGLFAALVLAKAGLNPVILERGKPIGERKKDVALFWQTGILNTSSNVQYGEGGAGTFSDGKLTTNINNPLVYFVLKTFYEAGAPEEILYLNKPHIGTDLLEKVVLNLRKTIESHGGTFYFQTQAVAIHTENKILQGIHAQGPDGKELYLPTNHAVFAIGHSARDTITMLHNQGVNIEPKSFSVGVRIEHPREMIDRIQYGSFGGHPALGAADYKLSCKTKSGRGVYTFCMCPGGQVVASSSEKDTVVTNGMSHYARNLPNSNSALLVSVSPQDFPSHHPLAGIHFQQELEWKAYEAGGGGFKAPVQMVGDFLTGAKSESLGDIQPSYRPGVHMAPLTSYLDGYITDCLKEAMEIMDRKLPGFARYDALLTGVETRSSSPVAIPRDHQGAANIAGIFPCGEGCGHAGGIMSAAVDGVRTAEFVCLN